MIRFARERKYTNPGSGIRTTYELRFSPVTGAQELFEKGKEDFQAQIQSYAESCDLSVIIRRINAGETDLLSMNLGSYGDFTGVPDNSQELFQARIDAKNTWSNLTDEQKAVFGDFDTFAGTAGSEEWFKNLGVEFKEEVKEVVEDADN